MSETFKLKPFLWKKEEENYYSEVLGTSLSILLDRDGTYTTSIYTPNKRPLLNKGFKSKEEAVKAIREEFIYQVLIHGFFIEVSATG